MSWHEAIRKRREGTMELGDSRSLPAPSLPAPEDIMSDSLRLTGQLPSTAAEIDRIQERFHNMRLGNVNEAVLAVRKSMGLPFTPLEELDKAMREFFSEGRLSASAKFAGLHRAILSGKTVVCYDENKLFSMVFITNFPWNSCTLATTLTLLMACSPKPESMLGVLKWQSRTMGRLPTMAEVSLTPSADLSKRFAQAKKAAIDGKIGKVTVLGVDLVDMEMIKRGRKFSLDMNYTSFAHSFVLVIGREGFRVYQSWGEQGEHGYCLDEYLTRGGSRLRTWQEGKRFIQHFQKLCCSPKMKWSPEMNNAYEECFEVNLDSICKVGRQQPPLVPVYRPWVRLFEINDVTVENMKKFTWDVRRYNGSTRT